MEHTSSMMELSWLLWKYMATSKSISPNEAATPAALRRESERERARERAREDKEDEDTNEHPQ